MLLDWRMCQIWGFTTLQMSTSCVHLKHFTTVQWLSKSVLNKSYLLLKPVAFFVLFSSKSFCLGVVEYAEVWMKKQQLSEEDMLLVPSRGRCWLFHVVTKPFILKGTVHSPKIKFISYSSCCSKPIRLLQDIFWWNLSVFCPSIDGYTTTTSYWHFKKVKKIVKINPYDLSGLFQYFLQTHSIAIWWTD